MGWGEGGDDESSLGDESGHNRLDQQRDQEQTSSNGSSLQLVQEKEQQSSRGSSSTRRNSWNRARSASYGCDEGARNDWWNSSRECKSISPTTNARGRRSFVNDGNETNNDGTSAKQKSNPYFMLWGSKQSFSSHEEDDDSDTDIVSSFIAGVGSAIHNSLSPGESILADEQYGKYSARMEAPEAYLCHVTKLCNLTATRILASSTTTLS
jgi:hypothetical protein